jgi:uncharacterized NAD(P)/FAD-binding protein YdhS
MKKRIAILGGGPSGLFSYKRLIESGRNDFSVTIFEANKKLGAGMPYSHYGANKEHITNVSGNEIPDLPIPVTDWMKTLPDSTLKQFGLDLNWFTEYMILPRLLFGDYLSHQFELLQEQAKKTGIQTTILTDSPVTDISDDADRRTVSVEIAGKEIFDFDHVIICTGHHWPVTKEGQVPGYFDSPYPPAKLQSLFNHPIAIRGSSLTAIDAIRTLARHNGRFERHGPHDVAFHPSDDAKDFRIVMHSRNGLLPCVRFHLDDPHLGKTSNLSKEDISRHRQANSGFLSLDFIFEKDFKDPLKEKDPDFYKHIEKMSIEEFVEEMLGMRERIDPFLVFKAEYAEAKASIKQRQSVYWKEMLAVLSFAMNYPAKHMSAEDMQRLRQVLMPLISVVIAFVPQSSCEELIALHEAGRLELIAVGDDGRIEIDPHGGIIYHVTDETGKDHDNTYKTFVDCIGQRHLNKDHFPFRGLLKKGAISEARLKFRSADEAKKWIAEGRSGVVTDNDHEYYLEVPGIAITDSFRAIGTNGIANPRIHVMAVPYIGGYNPDYSGLDFCEEASGLIVDDLIALISPLRSI